MQDVSERLHGHYFDLIRRLHVALRPRTYLEVGVHTGKSLELVGPETQIIGIDPTPAVRTRINDNAQLFFETSDEFFASHDVADLLGGQPIDMAFIDGMHLFEYALRDFRNIERWAEPDSMVMVHDCYPLDAASSGRVRDSDTWTGDTWKLVPCLRALRPDLEITTVAVKPSGLTLIRNLDPKNTVLDERYDEALERFGTIGFETIDGRHDEMLKVVANDWPSISPHIPSTPYASVGTTSAAGRRYPRSWKVVRHQATRQAKLAGRRVVDKARGAPAPV
ncbi:MAG TPA: class I SAM-dependent methyltransferase [Acidimicrobiia bacterium]|jgi:hypothetical protein